MSPHPTPAALDDFDCDAQPGVDCHLISELATCRNLDTATNEAASALLQVVSQRYLETSIVITTNRGAVN